MKNQNAELTMFLGDAKVRDKAEIDETRLEQIYDEYADSLFRYAYALTSSKEDAEDAVQEVFMQIAREAKRLRKVENLKAYLFTSTRNAAFSILRSRRRRNALDEATCLEEVSSESFKLEDAAISSSVLCEVFTQLSLEQREVLVLKVFDEMTFREIAETTKTSINTVAGRYRHGIEKLRRALGET